MGIVFQFLLHRPDGFFRATRGCNRLRLCRAGPFFLRSIPGSGNRSRGFCRTARRKTPGSQEKRDAVVAPGDDDTLPPGDYSHQAIGAKTISQHDPAGIAGNCIDLGLQAARHQVRRSVQGLLQEAHLDSVSGESTSSISVRITLHAKITVFMPEPRSVAKLSQPASPESLDIFHAVFILPRHCHRSPEGGGVGKVAPSLRK